MPPVPLHKQMTKFIVKVREESLAARADRAASMAEQVLDLAFFVTRLTATTKIVVYGERVASQVAGTFASNVVPDLRRALVETEILQLSRLWDMPDPERISIPGAYCLCHDHEVRRLLDERIVVRPDRDADDTAWLFDRQARFWRRLDRLVPAIVASQRLAGLRNFRDKRLAHWLTQSRAEVRGEMIRPPVYGDERKLLRATLTAIGLLNQATRSADFDYPDLQRQARRNAEAFWYGCQIKPLE